MKDDSSAINAFRNLLIDGFLQIPSWDFTNVLNYAQENVSSEDHALYSALPEAIVDEEKVPQALVLLDQRLATNATSGDEVSVTPITNGEKD
jgi:hypothetical protein